MDETSREHTKPLEMTTTPRVQQTVSRIPLTLLDFIISSYWKPPLSIKIRSSIDHPSLSGCLPNSDLFGSARTEVTFGRGIAHLNSDMGSRMPRLAAAWDTDRTGRQLTRLTDGSSEGPRTWLEGLYDAQVGYGDGQPGPADFERDGFNKVRWIRMISQWIFILSVTDGWNPVTSGRSLSLASCLDTSPLASTLGQHPPSL